MGDTHDTTGREGTSLLPHLTAAMDASYTLTLTDARGNTLSRDYTDGALAHSRYDLWCDLPGVRVVRLVKFCRGRVTLVGEYVG